MTATWTRTAVVAVGGLTELVFVPDSPLILVVSHQGRGVIDGFTGQVVARDRDENASGWFDVEGPGVLAIPPAEGWITVAGLGGGRLPDTRPGWSLEPGTGGVIVRGSDGSHQLLSETEDLRVFGFTPAGDIVIGTQSTLSIFSVTSAS